MQSILTAPCNPDGEDKEQEFFLSFLPLNMINLMNTRTEDLMYYGCNYYGTAIVVLTITIERMKNIS
jgi:hypothetical protein